MFKYEIVKRGRKWLHAVSEDGYKVQIEINKISTSWEVGTKVEFEGKIEKKRSGGYTKTFVFPQTAEEKKDEKEQKEIEKWLYYVELNAKKYVYEKGVNELKKYNLSEKQQERLNEAIITGTKKKIYTYLNYIVESLEKGRWYANGEKTVKECIKRLAELNEVEEVKYFEDRLAELKNQFEKEEAEREERYFVTRYVADCTNVKVGDIVKKDGKYGKVIKTWKYFEPETMSLGILIQEGAWLVCAKVDTEAVTEEEMAEYEAEEAEREAKKAKEEEIKEEKAEAEKKVNELVKYVQENGVKPDGKDIEVYGEIYLDTFNIYGGGKRIVFDNEKIWAIQNNGTDGSDWTVNNVRTGGAGAIGYYIKKDKKVENYLEEIEKHKKLAKKLEKELKQ